MQPPAQLCFPNTQEMKGSKERDNGNGTRHRNRHILQDPGPLLPARPPAHCTPAVTSLPVGGSVGVSLSLAGVAAWPSSAFLACFWARSASCLARRSARSSALLLPPVGFSPSLGPSAKVSEDEG